MSIKGMFQADISTADSSKTIQAIFYVSEGKATHCLMGKYTALDGIKAVIMKMAD